MNSIKTEDLKVGDSRKPIETLLAITGWTLDEALLRLTSYRENKSSSDTKLNLKSGVKSEVKLEEPEFYNLYMSINKREDDSDSDLEIVEVQCDATIANVSESVPKKTELMNLNDQEDEDMISEQTVIKTDSASNNNENFMENVDVKFEQTDSETMEFTKNEYILYLKRQRKIILKKYQFLEKLRNNREIEKIRRRDEAVRKQLRFHLGKLREKKKLNLNFLSSQFQNNDQGPDNKEIIENDSQIENSTSNEITLANVEEVGDSNLIIVSVVGGYKSPTREDMSDDENVAVNPIENESSLNEESFLNDKSSKSSEFKICENILQSVNNEKKIVNEEKEHMVIVNEEKKHMEIVNGEKERMEIVNGEEEQIEIVNGKKEHLEIVNGRKEHMEIITGKKDHMKIVNGEKELMVNTKPQTESKENNTLKPKHIYKNSSKLKVCENIKQSLEDEKWENDEQFHKDKLNFKFLKSLCGGNIISKPEKAIIPTKTKDITKIKGWRKKIFDTPIDHTPVLSKSQPFKPSALISKKLDHLLTNTPEIIECQATQALLNAPTSANTEMVDDIYAPSTSFAVIANSSAMIPTPSVSSDLSKFSECTDTLGLINFDTPIDFVSTDLNTANSTADTVTFSNNSSISSFSSPSTSSINILSQTIISPPSKAHTKPYKPKTLAEKRRLLEEKKFPLTIQAMDSMNEERDKEKLPLTIQAIASMNKEQRKENERRLLEYRTKLIKGNEPFDRESHRLSCKVTKKYNYILCNGRRLRVVSSKDVPLVTSIKSRKKTEKKKISVESNNNNNNNNKSIECFESPKKPSLLQSLRVIPKSTTLDLNKWETVEVPLPKVSLSIVPQYMQRIDPKIEHLIGYDTCILSEKRVKFALSLLKTTTTKSKLHSFKFPIPFANNQTTMKMKRRILVPNKPDSKVETEQEIQQGVNSVIEKILDYMDILDETSKLDISIETIESTDEPKIAVPIKKPTPRRIQSAPRSKTNKTALEMKRLNCKIVSVVNEDVSVENVICPKDICKLGCICKSIQCDSRNFLPIHCGSWKCIFKCMCKNNGSIANIGLPSGSNLLNAGVINRLQDEAKKNLAKIEKEFTQTIIKTDDQLIMVGDSRDRRRRVTKTPKKYSDFFSDEDVDSSGNKLVVELNGKSIKPCTISLVKFNAMDLIPYCIIHSLYRCPCIKSLDANVVQSTSSVSPIRRKPGSAHDTSGKKHKRYKAAPKPQTNEYRLKYVRKNRDDKTFNKEEFCSRTRGLPTSYYIARNTMESHLDKVLKNSKKFCKELSRYVRSLRINYKDLLRTRTSYLDDSKQAKTEEMHREVMHQTIDKLSAYLSAESHIDEIISRLTQRQNGIVTPSTAKRMRPCELPWNETPDKIPNRLIPDEDSMSNNNSSYLHAIVNPCRNTAERDPFIDNGILEKYMSHSKKREYHLVSWNSIQNNYNKKLIDIWYLSSAKGSPLIVTGRNRRRPTVNHCSIRIFEDAKEEIIPLDFIKCIIQNKIPFNKIADTVFVILAFNEGNCNEIYGICEKSTVPNKNIRVELLELYNGSQSKEIDVETVTGTNYEFTVITEIEQKGENKSTLYGELNYYNIKSEKCSVEYYLKKFNSINLVYENLLPALFETDKNIQLCLPRQPKKCKWRLIYTDQAFAFLRLSLNCFTIRYSDIMRVVYIAQKRSITVVLSCESIKKNYSKSNFGIYCVPNYIDKVFVGPYGVDEDHNIDILNIVASKRSKTKEVIKLELDNGVWVSQKEDYDDDTLVTEIENDNFIDLTEEEDALKNILTKYNCDDLLNILGISSEELIIDDAEDIKNYQEETYWNGLNSLMNGMEYEKFNNRSDSNVMEKIYYSMKNKCSVRYFITNIPNLGYIKAFLNEITNDVDISCPITNKIRRYLSYDSAINGIKKIISDNVTIIPPKLDMKVKMLTKLNPTMKTMLTSTVLDGYHIAGSFGVRNIRNSSRDDLKGFGLSQNEIDYVIYHRRKRNVYDLTNKLAHHFSIRGSSSKRPQGDVLTEVIKKIISTIKLSTAGSSIKNIEEALKLISLYPSVVKSKIYKQLKCVAFNFNKKELTTVELQKIRMNPTKRSAECLKSPIKNIDNSKHINMNDFKKVRLFPQAEHQQHSKADEDLNRKETIQNKRYSHTISSLKSNPRELMPLSNDSLRHTQFKKLKLILPKQKLNNSRPPVISETSNSGDVVITKLNNHLQNYGTTVIAEKARKLQTIEIEDEDDIILIEPNPQTSSVSLLRNQNNLQGKKRILQMEEDNVIIQPEPKKVKPNTEVKGEREAKNMVSLISSNSLIKKRSSVPNGKIISSPANATPQKPLQVLLANSNSNSLLKGKYVNLLPVQKDGKNKFYLIPNKNGVPRIPITKQPTEIPKLQNITFAKNKIIPSVGDAIMTSQKTIVKTQNGMPVFMSKQQPTPISMPNLSIIGSSIKPAKKQSILNVPDKNKRILPKMIPLPNWNKSVNKNAIVNCVDGNSYLTIQTKNATQCYQLLNGKEDVKSMATTAKSVRPQNK